jgi:hypothetical protein
MQLLAGLTLQLHFEMYAACGAAIKLLKQGSCAA